MKTRKTTRRALVMSILALLMCVSMLVGTTFAWFTDTATTAVNKIQAGTLDIDLVDANGASLVGEGLAWVKAEGAPEDESTLWEPGVTYVADEVYVMNKGTLALKYELKVNGVIGSAKLIEAIDFTINGADITSFSGTLQPGEMSSALVLKGHMHEDAGNEYQGLTLDGIAVTVYATQVESEYDSFNNTYDANASDGKGGMTDLVPTSAAADVNKDGNTVVKDAETNYNVKVTVPAAALADGATNINVTVTPKDAPDANVTVATDDVAQTFDVNVTGIKADNTAEIEVELFVGKNRENLKLFHNSDEITDKTYDASTGIVKFKTTSFSPYTVTFTNNWRSYAADSFATAVDTANKVVYIANAEEMALFAKNLSSYQNYTVKLTADINLSGSVWTPMGAWNGTFDGQNHTIKGLFVNADNSYGNGFFSYFGSSGTAVMKDVTFDGATVQRGAGQYSGNIYGIVAGYAAYYGSAEFENVTVKNSTVWGYGKVGGFFGMAEMQGGHIYFTNCAVNNVTVKGAYNCGGFAGNIQYQVSGCKNTATFTNCAEPNVTFVLPEMPDRNFDEYTTIEGIDGKYAYDSEYYYAATALYFNEYDAPDAGDINADAIVHNTAYNMTPQE